MHPAFAILLILLAVVFLLAIWAKIRVLRSARQRRGLSEEQFADALASQGIPREVGQAVFAGFRKWGSHISEEFPLTPEVALRDFVPWVEYDEVDIIHEVLAQTGRHWPPKQLLPCAPDWTLADVAKFVADCPRAV